jgi:hyperosmotically inducible protein
MKAKLTTCLIVGALFAPVAAYSADYSKSDSMKSESPKKETVKDAIKDSVITTKIKADFVKDKQVSAMHIKVDTDDKGVVTLSGNAKSQAEVDKAVSIAKGVKGVTEVKNQIMVGSTK